MAKRKKPPHWNSWIEFYNYLLDTKPELLRERQIQFMAYQPEGGVSIAYSISIATLEKECWRELQALRVSKDLTHKAGSILHQYGQENMEAIIKLLWRLEK